MKKLKKVALYVSKPYQNNRVFDINNNFLNRDNCLLGYRLLKEELRKHDIEVSTQDLISLESADLIIYNDMPRKSTRNYRELKSYLLIFESEIIRPDNWKFSNQTKFKKIFTWSDRLVDNKKFFKNNFSSSFIDGLADNFKIDFRDKNKVCCMVAGNHKNKDSRELYSERRKAIDWFEKNHPEKFDLYGNGWDLYRFHNHNAIGKALNRIKPLRKLLSSTPSSYQGQIKSKLEVMSNYKFAICYENAKDIKGYVTEKFLIVLVLE